MHSWNLQQVGNWGRKKCSAVAVRREYDLLTPCLESSLAPGPRPLHHFVRRIAELTELGQAVDHVCQYAWACSLLGVGFVEPLGLE